MLRIGRQQGSGPSVGRLHHVEQRPAIHHAARVQLRQHLVVELPHRQRHAVRARLILPVVDAQLDGHERLARGGFAQLGQARVEGVRIVKVVLEIVQVRGGVVDGLPHCRVLPERLAGGDAAGQTRGVVHVDFGGRESGGIQPLAQRRRHLPPVLRRLRHFVLNADDLRRAARSCPAEPGNTAPWPSHRRRSRERPSVCPRHRALWPTAAVPRTRRSPFRPSAALAACIRNRWSRSSGSCRRSNAARHPPGGPS